ncbi:hypothetical protein KRR39_02000 [Nocardioides panacis]|uniref:Uncharacterized protein n=1 Tax=Nocardioides panacis TaxID=2849501 RepID=A0A975Y0P1_9ACTN|nr:hypothetical protein [Nocardioides panacis]QWZ08660.1 hypothetical protein KRR39_02000 [Nocardioides panacis]
MGSSGTEEARGHEDATASMEAGVYGQFLDIERSPVSGSPYSSAYPTLGELPATGVAACLFLEHE